MKRKLPVFLVFLSLLLAASAPVAAHTLYMTVEDNSDGTVTVEGMFSTGASGAGVELRLENSSGKVIFKGSLDDDGEFTFKKPGAPYSIILDAGPGHLVREDGPE